MIIWSPSFCWRYLLVAFFFRGTLSSIKDISGSILKCRMMYCKNPVWPRHSHFSASHSDHSMVEALVNSLVVNRAETYKSVAASPAAVPGKGLWIICEGSSWIIVMYNNDTNINNNNNDIFICIHAQRFSIMRIFTDIRWCFYVHRTKYWLLQDAETRPFQSHDMRFRVIAHRPSHTGPRKVIRQTSHGSEKQQIHETTLSVLSGKKYMWIYIM